MRSRCDTMMDMTQTSTADLTGWGTGARGRGSRGGLLRSRTLVDFQPSADAVQRLSGPAGAQAHVPPPPAPLPHAEVRATDLCVVGIHGGSGASTVASLGSPGHVWVATKQTWPQLEPGSAPVATVLVARTHAAGMLAAQSALMQWASSGVDPAVRLVGLVLVADAPGRLPKALRDLAKVVGGGSPRTWSLPWCEAIRMGAEAPRLPRPYIELASDLRSLASSTVGDDERSGKELQP